MPLFGGPPVHICTGDSVVTDVTFAQETANNMSCRFVTRFAGTDNSYSLIA